jgi:hypothetical protein
VDQAIAPRDLVAVREKNGVRLLMRARWSEGPRKQMQS